MEDFKFDLILRFVDALAVVFWTYKKNIFLWFGRLKLKIFPIGFKIVFSIESAEGLNSGEYFKEIKKNFNNNMDIVGLSKEMKVLDISDIRKFKNKDDAEAFAMSKNIDLVIWGDFSNDILEKRGESINKLNIHFTFTHFDDCEKTLGKMLLLDIGSKLSRQEYWQILKRDSFDNVKMISNNISDLSLYILALILKFNGQIEKSVFIFEKLLNNLTRQDKLYNSVKVHLYNCYCLLVIDLAINHHNYKRGIELCNKILNLFQNDRFAVSNMATFKYRIGEKEEAKKLVKFMAKKWPKNSLTEVNIAFFRILQGNYDNAFIHYNYISKMDKVDFKILDLIVFLDGEYKISKEPALLYASGILSFYHGDKEIAYKDLRKFLKISSDVKYSKMRGKASFLLKGI